MNSAHIEACLETIEETFALEAQHILKGEINEIGALAQPDDIRFTGALPKTRSGKIMRRHAEIHAMQ